MIDGPPVSPHVSIGALFRGFLIVGVSGFGGVMPFAHRMLVERRRWLTEREFTEALSLSQFLRLWLMRLIHEQQRPPED